MKNQIHRALEWKDSSPLKMQHHFSQLCQQNFIQFVQSMITLAKQLAQQLKRSQRNLNNSFHQCSMEQRIIQNIKDIFSVINRQCQRLLNDKQIIRTKIDVVKETWQALQSILKSNLFSYKQLSVLTQSVSAFLSLADTQRLKQNLAKKQLQKIQSSEQILILAKGLLKCNIEKSYLLQIYVILFYQLANRFDNSLSNLVQVLQVISSEDQAVQFVCQKVGIWTLYIIQIKSILQTLMRTKIYHQQAQVILTSETFQRFISSAFYIDKITHLNQQINQSVMVQSRFACINFKMNKFKQNLLKLINQAFKSIGQAMEGKQTKKLRSTLAKLIGFKQIGCIVSDLQRFCKVHISLDQPNQDQLVLLAMEEYLLLGLFLEQQQSKTLVLEAINMKYEQSLNEFWFITCICNIQIIQEQLMQSSGRILNYKDELPNNINTQRAKKYKTSAVSQFTLQIIFLYEDSQQFLSKFCLQLLCTLLRRDFFDSKKMLQKYSIAPNLQNMFSRHTLNLYLYVISTLVSSGLVKGKHFRNLPFVMSLVDIRQLQIVELRIYLDILSNAAQFWPMVELDLKINEIIVRIEEEIYASSDIGPGVGQEKQLTADICQLVTSFIVKTIVNLSNKTSCINNTRSSTRSKHQQDLNSFRLYCPSFQQESLSPQIQAILTIIDKLFKVLIKYILISQENDAYEAIQFLLLNRYLVQAHNSEKYSIFILNKSQKAIAAFYNNQSRLAYQYDINPADQQTKPRSYIMNLLCLFKIAFQTLANSKKDNYHSIYHSMQSKKFLKDKLISTVNVLTERIGVIRQKQYRPIYQIIQFVTSLPNDSPFYMYLFLDKKQQFDDKSNDNIIQGLMSFLSISRSYLTLHYYHLLSNICIILGGFRCLDYLRTVFQKLKVFMLEYQAQIEEKDFRLIDIIRLFILQSIYQIKSEQKFEQWSQLCRQLKVFCHCNLQKDCDLQQNCNYKFVYLSKAQKQKIADYKTNFQIEFLKFQLLNIDSDKQVWQQLQQKFRQLQELKLLINFEDVSIIAFALHRYFDKMDVYMARQTILCLSKHMTSADLRKQDIGQHLLKVFDPFNVLLDMCFYFIRNSQDQTVQMIRNKKEIQQIVRNLKSFQIVEGKRRKIKQPITQQSLHITQHCLRIQNSQYSTQDIVI